MNSETITGIVASACTAASLIPQLLKVVREKKAGDISLLMLLVLFTGLLLWIWYGIQKDDPVIIISNALSLFINVLLSVYTWKYKDKSRRAG